MKTTAAGKIIGYALAPATKNGKVLMFVQPGCYATSQLASPKSNLAQLHRDNLQLHQENASLRNQFADVLAQVKQKGRPANTAPQDRTSVRIGLPGIRPAWQLLELRDGIWLFECRVNALEDSRWPDEQFVQQVVAQLLWGHQVRLLDRIKLPPKDHT